MTQVHFGLFFEKRFPLSTGDLGDRARKPNGALVCSKKSKKTSPLQHDARARARAPALVCPDLGAKKSIQKKRPYLAGENAKSGPVQVIRWRKNATFFLQKVPVFALFACQIEQQR